MMDKRDRPIRRWLIVFTLLLGPGVAAAEDQAEMREACAKQLTALGEVYLMYMGQNEGQPPPRLSELYYQAYTFEKAVFEKFSVIR